MCIRDRLLTSTNYDDNEKRVTGGRNGYGAKLANIYSTEFEVEIVDKSRSKKFKQTFSNNMSDRTKPKVSELKNVKNGYTKISFKPDLTRFGLKELTDDVVNLIIYPSMEKYHTYHFLQQIFLPSQTLSQNLPQLKLIYTHLIF